jgi:hypothetical protein
MPRRPRTCRRPSHPANLPKDYSADVVKDIAEKAWDVIQRSADIDVDDYVEEQKDRAADEKGEELPQNRRRERRESEWRK